MVERFVPAADMVVANRIVLEDGLMHREPGFSVMVVEVHGHDRLMAGLAFRIFSEAARSFREGIGKHEPLRLDDLAIHSLLPFVDSAGLAHAEAPTAAGAEIRLADCELAAVRPPPSHQMFRLAPRLEDELAGRVEDSRDNELAIFGGVILGAIFCHCCRPSSATHADILPGDRSSRPRSGDSGPANPQRP